MATQVFQCPMCTEFRAPSFELLLPHIRLVHSTKPGFKISCGISGCQRTFTNMKTYQNHMGFHIVTQADKVSQPVEDHDIDTSNEESCDEDDTTADVYHGTNSTNEDTSMDLPSFHAKLEQSTQDLQSHVASWILKTKECSKLTQSTMDNIIQDVTALTQVLMSKVHSLVNEALKDVDITESQVPLLSEIFNSRSPFMRPFRGLETAYLQVQYCRANFGLIVS